MSAVSARDDFARRVIDWQRIHGRHDLPWQGSRDPYRIWVSEIMLQQTQVSSVIPYFQRFMSRFPEVAALAAADEDDVLRHWSGLGYYARARNLHRAARMIADVHGGAFPRDAARIAELPGVGRSTAAAVAAFAFGECGAILDGNVKRVLARWLGLRGWPGVPNVQAALWREAEQLLPLTDIGAYTQGLMDLGSQVCTRSKPACDVCPVNADCKARRDGLTGILPEPRPKTPLPQRETGLLILARAGEVLLEKRPPTGIWGGLWSFPELSVDEDPSAVSDLRYGARIGAPRQLAAVEHGFTHFRLTLRPWHAQVVSMSHRANEPGLVWLSLAVAAGAAVPAPIRRLLVGLAVEGQSDKR